MKFEAWSAKDVEYLIEDAVETERLLPLGPKPREFGNSMPTPVRSREDYGKDRARFRRMATPAEVSRMMFALDAMASLPHDEARKFLWHWAKVKTGKGSKLSDFAAREHIESRTMRRMITAYCQRIANTLNQNGVVGLNNGLDRVSEIPSETASQTVASDCRATSPKHPLYHRADGAIPLLRPVTDDDRKRLAKEIERGNKRLRKARMRAKA